MFDLRSVRSGLIGATAAIAALAGVAHAQTGSITLFGQRYTVQRFDYSTQVQAPNFAFPTDPPITPFESEGTHYLGGNKLLMTFDDIADVFIGNPDNWIIEVNVLGATGCGVSGLSFSRTITLIDPVTDGYDPNPGGITINSSSSGLGAGGNIILAGNEGFLYPINLSTGAQVEYPVGSGCTTTPGACALNVSGSNLNVEDICFVPGNGGTRPNQLFLINQDLAGLDAAGVERRDVNGNILGTFLTGGATFPAINGAVAKGLAYSSDSPKLPAAIRRPDGVVLVSFDRVFPALQVYDVNGDYIASEILTISGTAAGPFRLDMSGCSQRLHIESLAFDPVSGRIFLTNQGTLLTCNYMWVLTPACIADFDGVDCVTVADIFAFLNAWFANQPAADLDNNGIGVQDIFNFLNAWFTGC
ncbi:MAG: hypothetical protein K2W85_15535 [Phycisphaerales bacterium]|nr:hypothetical protein [Phycisphaerales bacterium]